MKGKLLFSYDDPENIHGGFTPRQAMYINCGRDHVYTREQKDAYDDKYEEFKENIINHLKDINPSHLWESNVYPTIDTKKSFLSLSWMEKFKGEEDFKFKIHDGDEFLSRFARFEFIDDIDGFFAPTTTNIYEYGKTGVLVEHIIDYKGKNKSFNSIVLQACLNGFHRDWEHNAVCIQNSIKKIIKIKKIKDVDRAEHIEELKHSRAMQRNVEDAEGGW
jgi:hypothetical protein